jgi:hypothetical protein
MISFITAHFSECAEFDCALSEMARSETFPFGRTRKRKKYKNETKTQIRKRQNAKNLTALHELFNSGFNLFL